MENPTEPSASAPSSIEWKTFLESSAPGKTYFVASAFSKGNYGWLYPATPTISLFCDSEMCDGMHFFDAPDCETSIGINSSSFVYLKYTCRHCRRTQKVFSLAIKSTEDKLLCQAYKFGEFPPFGPHTPAKLISLLGPDRTYFLKGRLSESQGLGIAAFAYYRRIVENQKGRIIDEIIKVSDRIGGSPENREILLKAKSETQFSKAVETIKDAIPESLKIDGHSPLTLLHQALSEGLHEKDDNTCLELANSIRLVLTELVERIQSALKERKELTGALSKLLNRNRQQPGT